MFSGFLISFKSSLDVNETTYLLILLVLSTQYIQYMEKKWKSKK